MLAMLEHQILATVLQIVSGPGGAASFLRRNLLGKGLNDLSLPLDVGQTDEIPLHLRRLVALRDQTCHYPSGCDQPAASCEPHHVTHRADGGRTSLTNLKDYCWWHHHVVLHELGWTLTVHPDGTSQVQSPDGKIIRSHSPPPRPG
ncbi:MAG TPA: HNH endonuclease signature motif containing protein [Streptosporangiaceae bacterium]|nr:HNH endonuclease signature motif containing protein [Streptosporangiaceae bacterium]